MRFRSFNRNILAADVAQFIELNNSLMRLGISHEDITSLWGVLAAVLHLGNTTFTESTEDHGLCEIHTSIVSLDDLANLLGVGSSELVTALATQTVKASNRSSVTTKKLNVKDSSNNVNALIKWLYDKVFKWLLESINKSHSLLIHGDREPRKFIGILDIFGFEILGDNSFEQLCINYTNERLQQQFNDRIFASEQELYAQEGINWTIITYRDNQNVIDLISKKPSGLLYILEEHGMMNRTPDDAALLNHFHTVHEKNECYM